MKGEEDHEGAERETQSGVKVIRMGSSDTAHTSSFTLRRTR